MPIREAVRVIVCAVVLAAGMVVGVTACESGGDASVSGNEKGPEEGGSERRADSPDHGLEWSEPISVARGDARVGPWEMNDSTFHYVDDGTVAVEEDGTVAVAWVDNRAQNVFFNVTVRRGSLN